MKGQIIFVESEDRVYIGTSSTFLEMTPNSSTHNHDDLYYRKDAVDALFNTSNGHDHDGTNSKKVSYGNLTNVPTLFSPTTHDNTAHSVAYLSAANITFSLLSGQNLVGTGANQVSIGTHNHDSTYYTQTVLGNILTSAGSGASKIGYFDTVTSLGYTNVQNAIEAVVGKFANYRLSSDSYSKTDADSRYVNVADDELSIGGNKIFTGKVGIKTSGVPGVPLDIRGDANNNYVFIGDSNYVVPTANTLLQIEKKYSGDLSGQQIRGSLSQIEIDFNDATSPTLATGFQNELIVNSSYDLLNSTAIASQSKISHIGGGSVPSASVLNVNYTNSSGSNIDVKLLETSTTINSGNFTNLYSAYIGSLGGSLTGSAITNNYGLYIGAQNSTAVTNNYSIYTNAGKVRFGDTVQISTSVVPETTSAVIGAIGKEFLRMHSAEFRFDSLNAFKIDSSVLSAQKSGNAYSEVLTKADAYTKSEIDASHYTITQLTTAGSASVDWMNIANKPTFGSPMWQEPVANPTLLPSSGNSVGDVRTVADDGDGKQAQYGWNGTEWVKVADIDWGDASGIYYNDSGTVKTTKANVQEALYYIVEKESIHESNVIGDAIPPHNITLATLGAAPLTHSHTATQVNVDTISGLTSTEAQAMFQEMWTTIQTMSGKLNEMYAEFTDPIIGGTADGIFTEYSIDGGSADPTAFDDEPIYGGAA